VDRLARERDLLRAALVEIESVPVSWDKTELLQAFAAVKSMAGRALRGGTP
jgi:hypothetical protein